MFAVSGKIVMKIVYFTIVYFNWHPNSELSMEFDIILRPNSLQFSQDVITNSHHFLNSLVNPRL